MTAHDNCPHVSVSGPDPEGRRTEELRRAYAVMTSIVRLVWPTTCEGRSEDGVSWCTAIIGLHAVEDELIVSWCDEDHMEKFYSIAELGWIAVGHEGTPVIHENADLGDSLAWHTGADTVSETPAGATASRARADCAPGATARAQRKMK